MDEIDHQALIQTFVAEALRERFARAAAPGSEGPAVALLPEAGRKMRPDARKEQQS